MNYDVIIIGSGPAGLSAAIYACRSNLKTLVIENESFGGKLTKIFKIENYPGFNEISGGDLANNLYNHALKYGAEIRQGIVKKISDQKVILENEELNTKAIIVCSGEKEKTFDLPRAKEFIGKGISYCAVCDGFFFRKKDLVVIGDDKKAIEDALYLANVANKVYLLCKRADINAENSLVKQLLDTSNVEILYNCEALELIIENDVLTGLKTNLKNIACTGVFPHIGTLPNTYFLDSNLLNEKGYLLVDNKMTSKLPYLFGAGDVIEKELRQVVTACSEGAIAATNAFKYIKKAKGE